MSPGAGGVLAVLFLASAKPRFQRQARERKLKAACGSASVCVIMWADECLVIRSESDLQEALQRIGLAAALDRRRPADLLGHDKGPLTFGERAA
jgi:hypothetical protein